MTAENASNININARLHKIFEARAEEEPEQIALVDGRRTITYAELNSAADKLARKLHECGVGPEMLVGLCAHRSAELICGMLAVLKADGGYHWTPTTRLLG